MNKQKFTLLFVFIIPLSFLIAICYPSKSDLQINFLKYKSIIPKKGDAFFSLSASGLNHPVTIPYWLDITNDCFLEDYREGVRAFWIDEKNIYISQAEGMNCGLYDKTGLACYLLNSKSGKLTELSNCIESPTGNNATANIKSLGNSLYFVFGYMEGPGIGEIIKWIPGSTQTTLLPCVSGDAEVKDGFIFITSKCNPLTEEVPNPCDKKMLESCEKEIKKCNPRDPKYSNYNYCVSFYGKNYRWKWKPGMNPEMVEEIGYDE